MLTSTHELSELRKMAAAVGQDEPTTSMSARDAAQCLSGATRLLSLSFGPNAMRQACADLATHGRAWVTGLRDLPRSHQDERPVKILATLTRGILPLAGADNTRAAVAFWAFETDAAVLARVAA